MKRPMLISAFLGCAIVIAVYYCPYAIFAALLVLAVLLLASVHKSSLEKTAVILLSAVLICISLTVQYSKINRLEDIAGTVVTEDFVITEEPSKSEQSYYTYVKCISSNTLKAGDKLRLYYTGADLSVGDTLGASVQINAVSPEYKSSNYSEGVYATGYVKQFTKTQTNNSLICFVPEFKRAIKDIFMKSLTYENQALVSALTIGDRSDFTPEFEESVKGSGTSHVMVVSGMHLVILMGGLMSLIERIFYNKYAFFAISLVGVLFLMTVCGFTMSVIRAGITYLLLQAAPLFGRDSDSLNTLGATVVLVLVFSPFALFSIAFQLSVLSTFGILVLSPYITDSVCRILHIKGKITASVVSIISVTTAATIMTAPLSVWYFGYISLTSLLSNLLITHAVTALLFCATIGVLAALVLGFLPISRIFFTVAGILSDYVIWVIDWLGSLKYSTVVMPKLCAVIFAIIALLLILLRTIDNRISYIIRRRV